MSVIETQGFRLDNSGKRVVVDPITRIEGHLRVEVNLDKDNVIRNAVDALSRKGGTTVRIEATRVERSGSPQLSITVTDDGPGIDASVLPHLFEPFVSTRLDSRGTGLGLAVAEGIVKEHKGMLLARNRTDQPGAIFEVVLPLDQPVSAR
jgi:signal transduction histidine kinase